MCGCECVGGGVGWSGGGGGERGKDAGEGGKGTRAVTDTPPQ